MGHKSYLVPSEKILTPDEMFQAVLLAWIKGAAGSGHATYEVVDMAYEAANKVRDRERIRLRREQVDADGSLLRSSQAFQIGGTCPLSEDTPASPATEPG